MEKSKFTNIIKLKRFTMIVASPSIEISKQNTSIILILSVFLLISILGCSPEKIAEEPTTLTVFYNERKDTPFQADWLILEEYKKRQNIVLDFSLGDDSNYEKALIRTLESGNIPDIILKVWPETVRNYSAKGVFLPLSDYENLMPHFKKYIQDHHLEDELNKLRLDNGKYYILPGYQKKIQVQQWIYRRDVFEENGLAIPNSYDDLYNDLVYLKNLYPESTPITASWAGAHLFAMMGAGYKIPAGWNGNRYYNEEKNRWLFAPATENYKELFHFLNRAYEAGILDPEIFTQSDDEFYQKIQNGRAFVSVTWITSGFDKWNAKLLENGFPDGEWVALPVPESTMGIRSLPPMDPFRKGLVVSAHVINKPYFEKLIKFLDWAIYSEEGMILTTWGIEDVTFENTPGGKAFLPNIQSPNNPEGTINITNEYGFDIIFNLNENDEYQDYKKPPEIVTFLEKSLEADEIATMPPELNLNSNSIEAINIVEQILNPYVQESSQSFITGELDIEEYWDDYLIELKKRGYQTLEEIWNIAWEKQNN